MSQRQGKSINKFCFCFTQTLTICLAAGSLILASFAGKASGNMAHPPAEQPMSEANPSVTTRPPAPEIVSPKSFAVVSDSNLKIQWNPVEGADLYNVQVASDAGFYYNLVNERAHKQTEIQVSGLKPGTHYFVRVAAMKTKNAQGFSRGPFKSISFTTAGAAPAAQAGNESK